MTPIRIFATSFAAASTFATMLPAQDSLRHGHTAQRLGAVHFPTSCAPQVAPQFDRGAALLHSFEFGAAIRTFNAVLAADSTCAMAWWGIALSRWTNPMVPNIRPVALLESGREAAGAATRLAERASEREQAYTSAVMLLYADFEHRDQRARVVAYEAAMSALAARFPADTEARIFSALALVGAALPSDRSYASQLRAGAILESLFVAMPNHPGLAHYIIHSYDVPALARRASGAALRYADIAPAAAHALHMPSHTFTRLGMWKESLRTNLRSMEVAERDGSIAEALHAADYATYASLQLRLDTVTRRLRLKLPGLAARFDPAAVTGAAPGSAGVFALAAIPARYALERRQWAEAAALQPSRSDFPYAEALTYFARALGAAHGGDTTRARNAIDSLESIHTRLLATNELYWADQVAIQALGASAWNDFAVGHREEALTKMRDAATREDATEKAAVTPGPLAPARELLGDMLLALRRPAEALLEFRQTLIREPNRYRSLDGAARAANAAGDRAASREYLRTIARLNAR